MKQRIVSWLRRLADYLDPHPYKHATHALVRDADGRLGAGFGDAKRRDVYAALRKQFPEARKRDLAYAIERVMQTL